MLGGALASATILLFLFPFGAADIFDNIMHGRILGVYGGNPFHDVIGQFDQDRLVAYTAWRLAPSAYGPAWELLAGGTAWLVDWSVRLVRPSLDSSDPKPYASPYSPTSSPSSSSVRPPLPPVAASWQ